MNGMATGKVAGAPALPLSEDAPPDMLAGGMDLRVVLPCGSVTRCKVDRSTPMLDLLVQLSRAHRISPAAHSLQPFGLNNTPLHSQPSTPIGALDVFTVKIVPKVRPLAAVSKRAAPRPTPAQPFEQTFRLQVHLPRNQLFVTRASRATVLNDIRQLACREKNLDPNKYELRHPANLEQPLDPEATLGESGLTEVALVAAGGRLGGGLGLGQPLPDIMALRRQEDKRREAAKAGQYGFLTQHHQVPRMADGSVSSASSGSLGGRSTSPAPSDGERSTSPPAPQPLQALQPPSRPGRKRRPAPKPPVQPNSTEMNNNINKEVINSGGTVISHSRNSSDSSGYHEASVLSESPDGLADSLPARAGKLQSCVSQPNLNLSRSMTNLSMPLSQQQQLATRGNRNSIAAWPNGLEQVPGAHRASTNSLAAAGQRKKKAPPPPPPPAQQQPRPASQGPSDPFLKTQSLERQSGVPEPRLPKSSTLPACSTATTTSPTATTPVGPGSATSSSSSCPTPTPSEQSVHLSEADSDLGTEDLSSPRSDTHDDESSLELASESKVNKKLEWNSSHTSNNETQQHRENILKLPRDEQDSCRVEVMPEDLSQSGVPTEEEWEYRLPSPPSAFRDDCSHSASIPECDSLNLPVTNVSSSANASELMEELPKPSEVKKLSNDVETTPSLRDKPPCENQFCSTQNAAEGIPSTKLETEESKKKNEEKRDSRDNHSARVITKTPSNDSVINTAKSVINSNVVPKEAEKKLAGSAAVLDELNKVLNEQRCGNTTIQSSYMSQSESILQPFHEPAPIENFSMAVYSRPTSAEGMPPPEVRPSLVLARRSSFSNSNGNLSVLPRPLGSGAGVRRTTSHATLVGSRRESCNSNDSQPTNRGAREDGKNLIKSARQQDLQPLGRAVSEMNLCGGLQLAPIEPELLQEFMEWRQQRQREQLEKERQKVVPASDLQSPQVLRTILSKSQDDVRGKNGTDTVIQDEKKLCDAGFDNLEKGAKGEQVEEAKVPPVQEPSADAVVSQAVEEPVKRIVPRGPPSIQLSTWHERPKRQVSIKMDRDYWIGVGKAALRPTQNGRDKYDMVEKDVSNKAEEIKKGISSNVGSHCKVAAVSLPENISCEPPVSQKVFPAIKPGKPPGTSETVQRLSKQYIVHTTPSGFRRSVELGESGCNSLVSKSQITEPVVDEPVIVPKLSSVASTGTVIDTDERVSNDSSHQTHLDMAPVEVSVTPKNDPSRVPIVRAVELKKSVAASDVRKPSLTRQNATTNSSVVYFSSGPFATSSVSANAKTLNGNGASNSAKPVIKKFTSVVDISGPSNDKTSNGVLEQHPMPHVPSVQVNGFSSLSEPKKTLPMPVVKGFKLAQSAMSRQLSAPAATPPPPAPPAPPAPVMPTLRKVPRPSSLPAPARTQDPREQLLDAIRNFGGRTNLRPTT